MAITFGTVPPVVAVSYGREGGPRGADSGFLLVFTDAPPPDEIGADTEVGWLCLHCVIEEFPEVGAALELARTVGEVRPDGAGGWVPLDEVDDA